jgi:lipoate-protein ligase B
MGARVLRVSRPGRVPFREAWEEQRRLAARVAASRHEAHLLLLEHPPVITLGRNASPGSVLCGAEELARRGVAVEACDRGGDATYHGPGQVVGYPILHLPSWKLGVARFVHALEAAMARACAAFGVEAAPGAGAIGVWTRGRKIGSVGIHVSRGVTTHGFALNACPDLGHFRLIHPCGMPACEMTSLEREAGRRVSWEEAAAAVEPALAAALGADAVAAETCHAG